MLLGELENVAESLYRDAGWSGHEQAPLVTLANRLLGEASVRLVSGSALPGNGSLARVGDRWRIYLRKDAPEPIKRFVLLHELAHWALGKGATEQGCDALAAALLAPRQAFLCALSGRSRTFAALARRFGASESCIALRVGETTGQPLALVTSSSARVRGSKYPWPKEAELRQAGACIGPGVRKVRLSDDPTRLVLTAQRGKYR